ncbi:MAG: hypothetical protein AB9869_30940 [Verrucomicrobiia bacterium]
MKLRIVIVIADLTLRHGWFRVLLHLGGMLRRPRNALWHLRHIVHELHDDKPSR